MNDNATAPSQHCELHKWCIYPDGHDDDCRGTVRTTPATAYPETFDTDQVNGGVLVPSITAYLANDADTGQTYVPLNVYIPKEPGTGRKVEIEVDLTTREMFALWKQIGETLNEVQS